MTVLPHMNQLGTKAIVFLLVIVASTVSAPGALSAQQRTITDMAGRRVTIPSALENVVCSGSGCLRLLTYLQAQEKIVAVDTAETAGVPLTTDIRPYAMANPQFSEYPVFGDFRGMDNPELILGLPRRPQVILKIEGGYDYGKLELRTGIPVVVLGYGNLCDERDTLYRTLRLMAAVVGAEQRAEQVIEFLDEVTADISERGRLGRRGSGADRDPTVYIGGIAMRGGHGFNSTGPSYTPFTLLGIENVAAVEGRRLAHAVVSREKLLIWDPDIIFIDLGIMGGAGGLDLVGTDPVYSTLSAVAHDRLHGVLPYNSYNRNFETVLANSYYIGKVLYPDAFQDIDPRVKADEIYSFLIGVPLMHRIEQILPGQVFQPLSLR